MKGNPHVIVEFGNNNSNVEDSSVCYLDGSIQDDPTNEIAAQFYEQRGYTVFGIDATELDGDITDETLLPDAIQEMLREKVGDLEVLDQKGKPDLLIYKQSQDEYHFVEVKKPRGGVSSSQLKWAVNFEQLPHKLCFVYEA